MNQRWLLQLGSNLTGDKRLHQALRRLAEIGSIRQLTAVRHLPPRSGIGPWYFNVLVECAAGLTESDLRAHLHALEAELGRDRDDAHCVAIDIDLIARQTDGRWQANAHARDKGELDQYPTRQLLAEAGIALASQSESNRPPSTGTTTPVQ